jgi:hypothetical protein
MQLRGVCHDTLDFIQVPGFPSAILVFALIHSRRNVVPTLVVAYDVFFPRKHPSGFPSMSHRFPRAPFSFSLDVEHQVAYRMSSLDRGRCLVLTTIVITLLGNLLFVVLPATSDSIPSFAGTILAFCAVAALLYAMWRGQRWARWLLVALYVVGLAVRLTLIFRSPHVLDIARATQQFVAACLLAAPPSVGAFLATQRNPRAEI